MIRKAAFILPPALALVVGMALLQHYAEMGKTLAQHGPKIGPAQARPWLKPSRLAGDSTLTQAALTDSLAPRSPFGMGRPSRPSLAAMAPKPVLTRPPLILKGTVGGKVATLITADGVKNLVRLGQTIDSAEVIRIMPGKVILRDRHGTFEVTSQE